MKSNDTCLLYNGELIFFKDRLVYTLAIQGVEYIHEVLDKILVCEYIIFSMPTDRLYSFEEWEEMVEPYLGSRPSDVYCHLKKMWWFGKVVFDDYCEDNDVGAWMPKGGIDSELADELQGMLDEFWRNQK